MLFPVAGRFGRGLSPGKHNAMGPVRKSTAYLAGGRIPVISAPEFCIQARKDIILAACPGFHFNPSFRKAPAFNTNSSFGIMMRIGELSSLNPQPTATIIDIVSGVFNM
ncbi:MAG: hypothetical protein WBM69_24820 [Desulfobacterales bacterium]